MQRTTDAAPTDDVTSPKTPCRLSELQDDEVAAGIMSMRMALIFWSVIGIGAAPIVCRGEAPTGNLQHIASREFRIPLSVDPLERPRVHQVQLYLSTDQGRHWVLHSNAPPGAEHFSFSASHDGEYWFASRTRFRDGKEYPAVMSGVDPETRVVVDTIPPAVNLRGLQPTDGQIGVEWEIMDDHLNMQSMRLEFADHGASDWNPIAVRPSFRGREMWDLGRRKTIDVRLRVSDLAGNVGHRTVALHALDGIPAVGRLRSSPDPTPADSAEAEDESSFAVPPRPQEIASASPGPPVASVHRSTAAPRNLSAEYGSPRVINDTPRRAVRLPEVDVHFVKSTTFNIEYSVEQLGKSGLGSVSLYWTTDRGKNWFYHGDDDDCQSPFSITVSNEGVYGFSLIAQSGAGFGSEAPAPDDPPQILVEVDLVPPFIKLHPPELERPASAELLSIRWDVQDPNLAPRPISLFYSETMTGPWTTIGTKITNTDSYRWKMPADIPYKFYVRLQALDRAGNVATVETDHPVVVDTSKPSIKITRVSPHSSDTDTSEQ